MEILWWKILFTPQAIRHFCRDWQHSSSGAISSYLWELSLIFASPGHRTQFTFQKYPCLGPQMTTSGDFPAKTIPYTHTVFKWSWPQVVAHNPTHDTNMATTLHMIPTWPTTLHMMPTYNLISLLDTSLVRVIWSNTALR